MREFKNFTDCYLSLIKEVYGDYEYESSPRGQKIKEKLGVSFRINDPSDRYPFVLGRKFSPTYFAAEMLWYLTGNNSTKWISNYSKFWANISDDGLTANSAYGARIFHKNQNIAMGRLNQWEFVKSELRKDPDSRRAIIHLRTPDDSVDAKLDVPCTLALQFFIRDELLHMVVNMRSSDLIFGIAYDIPAFTFFQEMLSLELGVGLGSYTHCSNSLHIYERHFGMVESILDNKNIEKSLAAASEFKSMPRFKRDDFLSDKKYEWLDKLSKFEEKLQLSHSEKEIKSMLLGFYGSESKNIWTDVASLLTYHRLKKIGSSNSFFEVAKFDYSGYNFDLRKKNEV